MKLSDCSTTERRQLATLEERIGRVHVRQRLGLEGEHESHVVRRGTHFFHLENWTSTHGLIRAGLSLAGLRGRGRIDRRLRRGSLWARARGVAHVRGRRIGLVVVGAGDLHRGPGLLVARRRGLHHALIAPERLEVKRDAQRRELRDGVRHIGRDTGGTRHQCRAQRRRGMQ